MSANTKKLVKALIPIIIALISMFGVARLATSAETPFNAGTIASLDEKKSTVMELTAASTAASAAITLLPGDTATPIADKLADLSSYFLIVICALYLEKYLVTIMGYATFMILIPLGCLACVVNVFQKDTQWKAKMTSLSIKLFLVGAALFLVVPVSVKLSNMIEATYRSSIESTIDAANETAEAIEGEHSQEGNSEDTEDSGWLSGIISSVESTVTGVTEKVKTVLNDFMEALAIMIVTCCLIPILVLLFFLWIIKLAVGVDLKLPIPKKLLPGNS